MCDSEPLDINRFDLTTRKAAQYQGKCPFILFIISWCRLLEHSSLKHFCLDQFSVIQGNFYIQVFSNTSFGRTLLVSDFGCLLLEQTLHTKNLTISCLLENRGLPRRRSNGQFQRAIFLQTILLTIQWHKRDIRRKH